MISVIPLFHPLKIDSVLSAQPSHFFFCESDITAKFPWLDHRVLFKIRYGRLLSILLNRKNSCHICRRKYLRRCSAAFKHGTEEFQIFLLNRRIFTDRRIPLINNHNKLISSQFNCMNHRLRQFIAYGQFWIRSH